MPRRVTLKLKPPVKPDNALSVDQSESTAIHERTAQPTTKKKSRPPRVRTSKPKKSIPEDSAPLSVVSPALRSRLRNESEISALDLGPSFTEGVPKPSHTQNRAHGASEDGRQSNEQPLQPSKVRFSTPLQNEPAPAPMDASTYGDLHDAGYGFGFGEEVAGLLSSGMLPPGTESEWSITPSTPESIRYQRKSPSDMADQELLDVRNQELQRYEQSLALFPDISVEECMLEEDEF